MQHDEVLLLECNLDDSTGEELGYVLELLFERGALDAWFTPIYMKKNRPATKLSVLCHADCGVSLRRALLEHTTTLGVRWQTWRRDIARREVDCVETPWGPVRRKLKFLGQRLVSIKPEYDDCAALARQHSLPIREVIEAARQCPAEGERDRRDS